MIIIAPLMILSGAALGFFYFSGLWWTIQKLGAGKNQIGWLVASYMVRASILAAALYILADRDWQRLLLLAGGFTISRFVCLRKWRAS